MTLFQRETTGFINWPTIPVRGYRFEKTQSGKGRFNNLWLSNYYGDLSNRPFRLISNVAGTDVSAIRVSGNDSIQVMKLSIDVIKRNWLSNLFESNWFHDQNFTVEYGFEIFANIPKDKLVKHTYTLNDWNGTGEKYKLDALNAIGCGISRRYTDSSKIYIDNFFSESATEADSSEIWNHAIYNIDPVQSNIAHYIFAHYEINNTSLQCNLRGRQRINVNSRNQSLSGTVNNGYVSLFTVRGDNNVIEFNISGDYLVLGHTYNVPMNFPILRLFGSNNKVIVNIAPRLRYGKWRTSASNVWRTGVIGNKTNQVVFIEKGYIENNGTWYYTQDEYMFKREYMNQLTDYIKIEDRFKLPIYADSSTGRLLNWSDN